jgi:hypothetical protein
MFHIRGGNMVHISILIHPWQTFARNNSWLGELCGIWKERGLRVTLVRGPAAGVQADAVFHSVDLTRTPAEYVAFLERHPVVINRRVTDISKRRISRHLVDRPEDFDGPVIIKTDLNCNGMPEIAYAHHREDARPPTRDTSWATRTWLPSYPILGSTRAVPPEVWSNPGLVVERFLPERKGELFCIRTWIFLGEAERVARFFSNSPIIKSNTIVGRERLHDVPEDLRRLRKELGFDFGKFDFAIVDGKTVLYDANRTPTLGVIPRSEILPWLTKFSDGLWTFIRRPPDIPEAPDPDATTDALSADPA